MGGGGVIRTAAAKVGGVGVLNKSLRGFTAVPTAEQSVRNGSRPVSPVLTSSQQNLTAVSGDGVNQRISWEVNDWEFAGGQDDLLLNSGESMPRVVFGGVPSLEEAKEATSELKHALDKVYASPFVAVQESGFVGKEVSSDSIVSPSEPKHAFQAFRLLKESPVAQNVVAAIACDPNVWNAVLQNEALKEYMVIHKTYKVEESVEDAEFQYQECPGKVDGAQDSNQSENSGSRFTKVMQNIKLTVTDMVNSISGFVHNIFGSSEAEHKSTDADEKSDGNNMGILSASSFMALAVTVIMVVVLRRV